MYYIARCPTLTNKGPDNFKLSNLTQVVMFAHTSEKKTMAFIPDKYTNYNLKYISQSFGNKTHLMLYPKKIN